MQAHLQILPADQRGAATVGAGSVTVSSIFTGTERPPAFVV